MRMLLLLFVLLFSSAGHSNQIPLSEYLSSIKVSKSDTDVVLSVISSNSLYENIPGMDVYLLLAIMEQESTYRHKVRAKSGSLGLMQIVPRWHKDKIRNRNIMDPYVNVEVGIRVYSDCYRRFKDQTKALTCYNGGGTKNYAKRVLTKRSKLLKRVFVDSTFKESSVGKLTIVGAGGAGINIASSFVGKKESGYADIDVLTIDTSNSNIRDQSDKSKVYLFEGKDGSGKVRALNYETISERSKEILQRIGQSDIVLLVHSAGGGSGSVIGPVLASELINKNRLVSVVLIGSTSSTKEVDNTLKTIKSYANIAETTGIPISLAYFENSSKTPRSKVDEAVKTHIIMTSLFFSGEHRELDRTDLDHFLQYTKVTEYKPAIVRLEYFDGTDISLNRDEAIVAAVTLTTEEVCSDISYPIEYQAVGFLPKTLEQRVMFKMPLHAVLILNAFNPVISNLEESLSKAKEMRSAIVEKPLVPKDVASTKEGVIL